MRIGKLALNSLPSWRKPNKAILRCGLLVLALLPAAPLSGQSPAAVGIPYDWSHHRLVFSQPGSLADGLRLQTEPRFWHQWYRRNIATRAPAADERSEPRGPGWGFPSTRPREPQIHKDWSMDMGSGATVGAANFPAKYSFVTNAANCGNATTPDFVVYNTSLAGTTSQASVVAYDNLYTGCTGTAPSVYWAYNTGGTIGTSVVLSANGTQVAFIHSSSGGASLNILRWKSSTTQTASSPGTLTPVAAASYYNCTAPCMTTIAFSGSHNDTRSSAFYDYTNDVLYVGDDSGVLHKFQHVFNSTVSNTPGEIAGGGTSSGWPVTISANKLTSPVLDSASARVFVADAGGYLYSEPAGGGSSNKLATSQLAVTGSTGIVDAPLVDSTTGYVYVWVGQDGNTVTNHNCDNATGCDGVFRFSITTFTTAGTGTCSSTDGATWTSGTVCGAESVFGSGSTTTTLYDGTFDNAYYTGSTGTTGNLWTCAAKPGPEPRLNYSPMSSFPSVIGVSGSAINPIVSGNATCSPVTDIYNGSTDLIFLSVTASGNQTGCSGACVYSFNVTSSAPTSATAGLTATGGSSGIVIDNTVAPGTIHTSQTYFSTLSNQSCAGNGSTGSGTGGCAVQASQAALN
jgi:hypothetical protein